MNISGLEKIRRAPRLSQAKLWRLYQSDAGWLSMKNCWRKAIDLMCKCRRGQI